VGPAKAGRKRAGGAAGGAAAKKSRGGGGGDDDVLLHVDLSDRRKARVRRYEGRLHVDVREFYKVRAPYVLPPRGCGEEGPAGVHGLGERWRQKLNGAILHKRIWFHQLRRLSSFTWVNRPQCEPSACSLPALMSTPLAHALQKDGEDAPTQKGLAMDPGQWARLARELPRLVAAQRAGGGGGEVAPAQLAKTRLASVSEFK
jgi:hypothetical protein